MARAKGRSHHSSSDNGRDEMENGADEMHDAARRKVVQMERSTRAAFGAFDVFNGPMARIMDQNWSMFHKMLHAMQQESLRFVNRRLEHTSHSIESSRECQGVSGLMAVQQEWMLEFARDYAEQSKRFAELVRDLADDGTGSVAEASADVMERSREEVDRHRAAA